jgi:hypothetical protein
MSSLAVCRDRTFTKGGRFDAQRGAHLFACLQTWHGALFGRQSSLDNLLNGFAGTEVEDSSKPALLFRRKMNRHAVLLRGSAIFTVGEKMTSGKSKGGFWVKNCGLWWGEYIQ